MAQEQMSEQIDVSGDHAQAAPLIDIEKLVAIEGLVVSRQMASMVTQIELQPIAAVPITDGLEFPEWRGIVFIQSDVAITADAQLATVVVFHVRIATDAVVNSITSRLQVVEAKSRTADIAPVPGGDHLQPAASGKVDNDASAGARDADLPLMSGGRAVQIRME